MMCISCVAVGLGIAYISYTLSLTHVDYWRYFSISVLDTSNHIYIYMDLPWCSVRFSMLIMFLSVQTSAFLFVQWKSRQHRSSEILFERVEDSCTVLLGLASRLLVGYVGLMVRLDTTKTKYTNNVGDVMCSALCVTLRV